MALMIGMAVAYATALEQWFLMHDTYTTVSFALVIPTLLLVPRLLFRLGTVKDAWRATVERIGMYIVVLNAAGTAYFHTIAPQYQYDRLLHFVCAFWSVPLVILLLVLFRNRLSNPKRIIVIACVTIFLGIFLWEGFQYFSDQVFRSRSFYDARQAINRDFIEDVIFGILGILASIPYVRKMIPVYRGYIRT